MAASVPDAMDRLRFRMQVDYLEPLPEDSSMEKTTSVFRVAFLSALERGESSCVFKNRTPYLAEVFGKYQICPWGRGRVEIGGRDSVDVKYLPTKFDHGVIPLKDFLEKPEGTFSLRVGFWRYTHANLQWNKGGKLELKLRNDLRYRDDFEFVNDLAFRIEDLIICMKLKDGREERFYRRIFKENSREIESITTQVADKGKLKTIVLLAESQ